MKLEPKGSFPRCMEKGCDSTSDDVVIWVGADLSPPEPHATWLCRSCIEKALAVFVDHEGGQA